MKNLNISLIALSVALLTTSIGSAHAAVVVAPADKSPTAVQNSGATYDRNDVTNNVSATNARAANPNSDLNNAARMGNRTLARDQTSAVGTTTHTVLGTNDAMLSRQGVAMNGVDQQQQQVAPTHSAMPWLLFLLAVIVAGAIYYTSRKRDTHLQTRV